MIGSRQFMGFWEFIQGIEGQGKYATIARGRVAHWTERRGR
jgi:hypothetical protein